MKEKVKNLIFNIFALVLMFFSTQIVFDDNIVQASEVDPSVLIKKVSNSYTNKFCNAIGFGLSKESAMDFSLEENNKVFEKKRGIKDINKELLAKETAISVIEKCGYPIGLSGQKGIDEFKEYYLAKNFEYMAENKNGQ